ncbi:MAG TPA: hypothetical protein VFY82_09280 [Acidimicrobiales bacterium]|nr:hypothetical protein [Acidimicrobiales bacterium]
MARRLAFDGTWGVVAGDYQAASSSPLWTLLLAPTQLVARGAWGELVPLVLNVVAGVWVLRLLRPDLSVLRPSRQRPLDVLAVVGLVVGPLFLPGLSVMGMEHTLHMGATLAVCLAVEARWGLPPHPLPPWLAGAPWWAPVALMAVATGVRFESVALAPACAVALVAAARWADPPVRSAAEGCRVGARPLVGLSAAAAGTIAVTAAWNLAHGQRILPNSVVVKSLGDRGDARRSVAAAIERLLDDPLLVACVLVAVAVLVVAWRGAVPSRRVVAAAVFPAVVTLVAITAQVWLGAVEPSLRYQAYLYGLGVWTLLRAVPLLHPLLASRRPAVPAAVVVLAFLPAALPAVAITADQPNDSAVLWRQRYQVARFLEQSYRDEPIAIGELGYISLYHEGPLTDVYGLADREVLDARMDDDADAEFWAGLQQRRGFPVVVTYSFSLGSEVPDGWIPVAEWRSPDAYYTTTRFWAAVPEEVAPLTEHLQRFERELPAGVEVSYNELAGFAAAARMD